MFKTEVDQMTLCVATEHVIETKEEIRPIVSCSRRIPVHFEGEIEKEINKLKRLGIIEESKSKWSSAIVPVNKSDGTIRMCIDYRKLNLITIKDAYPIPRIDQILDSLAKAEIFSTLDATSGYYQIGISQQDKEKTAFNYKGLSYQFTRMPFGLCNAPSTFQRAMDQIFKKEIWQFVIPYLDDIIVFSKDVEEHKTHLEIVFGKLKAAGMALNESKCKLFRKEVKILGNVISKGIVKPDPMKIEAIRDFNRPETVKQLRSFLGLANYSASNFCINV